MCVQDLWGKAGYHIDLVDCDLGSGGVSLFLYLIFQLEIDVSGMAKKIQVDAYKAT